MDQLPLFVNVRGQPVILIGEGEAAEAKRRLIERAGGVCVGESDGKAVIAFVAIEDEMLAQATATRLKMRGLMVNVVDRPKLCDFTVPAIVDRDPLLVAVGTGGASAGLAKMVRQAIERLLPARLGELANGLKAARAAMRHRWPEGAERRRQLDAALVPGGILDPLDSDAADRIEDWLQSETTYPLSQLVTIELQSNNPDDLSLGSARLLGQADHIFVDGDIDPMLVNRARADATRIAGPPYDPLPAGLVIHLRLRQA